MTNSRSWIPISLPSDIPPPTGAYSPAVRAGDLLFVSGQVPRDLRTGELLGRDVHEQARHTLANLRQTLEAAGATLDDVIAVTAYLADIGAWGVFNEVYKETFRPPYPTRTVVGAQLHGFLVEVTAVAHLGRRTP
jgi:2-iminobutanoate/2-iminopropanoate deaminase